MGHVLVESHGGALGDSACRGGGLLDYDPSCQAARSAARKIRRERLRLLVECRAVSLLLVRRGGLRAGAGADALGAWVVLHDMRARFLVWLGLEWRLRGVVHLLEDRRADGYGAVVARRQARDRTAVVAPLDSASVLLALVLGADRHGRLVRVHELLGALDHVRLLRDHGDAVPQGRNAVRHLHHSAAAGADAGGHVRDSEGRAVPGRGGRVPREQDEFGAWLEHVRELLRVVLQALRRQLLPEVEGRAEEGLAPGGRAEFEPEGDAARLGLRRDRMSGRGGGDDEEVELKCPWPHSFSRRSVCAHARPECARARGGAAQTQSREVWKAVPRSPLGTGGGFGDWRRLCSELDARSLRAHVQVYAPVHLYARFHI